MKWIDFKDQLPPITARHICFWTKFIDMHGDICEIIEFMNYNINANRWENEDGEDYGIWVWRKWMVIEPPEDMEIKTFVEMAQDEKERNLS